MVLCPIALAVGCRKCPVFNVCPVKSVIGDYKPDDDTSKKAKEPAGKSAGGKSRKAAPAGTSRRTASSSKGRKAARKR
jgi:hypothetical protein